MIFVRKSLPTTRSVLAEAFTMRRPLMIGRASQAETAQITKSAATKPPDSTKVAINQQHAKKLAALQNAYMDKLNQKTMDKHFKEKRLKKHHRITGALLFVFVVSIYFYSMYAVKQETFLEDFELPTPPNPATPVPSSK